MYGDDERRTGLSAAVKASIHLCSVVLVLLALEYLIDDPRAQTEIAAAKEARERKQLRRYEARRFEEQEQIDEDALRNVRPYKL